jgi:hypothetical protein
MDTNMLNESNSSFDTMPSFVMDLEEEQEQERDGIISDEEDEGYNHVDASESSSGVYGERTGILILPPAQNNSIASSHETDLSLPDSVPSDLNSILHLPDPVVMVHDLSQSGEEPPDEEPDLLNGSTQHLAQAAVVARKYSSVSTAATSGHNRLIFLVSVVVAALSIAVTLHLVHERQQLKEQVRGLQALEHAYMESLIAATLVKEQEERTRELEEQVRQLKKEADESKPRFTYPWESKDDAPLIDNCWLHANAKMEFGECSRKSTETVVKHVQSLGKSVYEANERIWDKMRGDYKEMKAWLYEHEKEKEPSPTTAENKNARSGTESKKTKKDKESTKMNVQKSKTDFQALTKSILQTAALGTAAAVFLSAVDWFGKDDE